MMHIKYAPIGAYIYLLPTGGANYKHSRSDAHQGSAKLAARLLQWAYYGIWSWQFFFAALVYVRPV